MKKICVFIGSRANYSSIKSAMYSIERHPFLDLQIVVGASAVLDRFGKVEDLIEKDGFVIHERFHNIVEGENLQTMAQSTGLGLIYASTILGNLDPDWVVIVGDRFEMMSFTLAAAYMNIRVAHTMGGEVTGTIDESIRHAITKFAHAHFTASKDAHDRVIKLGESSDSVFLTGCPRIDLVKEELRRDSYMVLENIFEKFSGVGPNSIDLRKPFLLVSQHPVTTEYSKARESIEQTLFALERLNMPVIMLWPNIDAGSDEVSKGIRVYREVTNRKSQKWLKLFKNLPIHYYIHLMNTCACLIGNSSSGIREAAFIGTPVVNIGTRQNMRQSGKNVIHVETDQDEIVHAVKTHLKLNGKYPSENIYGDGHAGEVIAEKLSSFDPPIQKKIMY